MAGSAVSPRGDPRVQGGEFLTEAFWGAGSVIIVVYALVPVLWILSLSLKPSNQLTDQRFLPQTLSLDSYRQVFTDPQFPAALRNSLGIALISTVLAVILAMFAAYAIERVRSDRTPLLVARLARDAGLGILSHEERRENWRAAVLKMKGLLDKHRVDFPAIPEIGIDGKTVAFDPEDLIPVF